MKKVLVLIGLLLSTQVWATVEEDIRSQLTKLDPNIPILSIDPIELEGFYAVSLASGEVLYVNEKATYVFSGDLFQMRPEGGVLNLTEQRTRGYRLDLMGAVQDGDMIIYPAEGERLARISVFTDIDCPYCRKLHEEVPTLNEMGIEVAYLAFPRSGPGGATAKNMESIWCAEGESAQRAAMDAAKAGFDYEAASCDSPVIDQLALGQQIGVTGTPALVLEDGQIIPGYMSAARIKQLLNL